MKRGRTSLMVMEQLAMLLVFALAAAICLGVFVSADQTSRRIQDRDRAAELCQNAAETLRHTGGDVPGALAQVNGSQPGYRDGFGYFISYGPDWSEFVPDGVRPAHYTLRALELDSDVSGLGKAEVEVYRWQGGEMESLFRLETAWQEVSVHGA